jgi:hypothetical protein
MVRRRAELLFIFPFDVLVHSAFDALVPGENFFMFVKNIIRLRGFSVASLNGVNTPKRSANIRIKVCNLLLQNPDSFVGCNAHAILTGPAFPSAPDFPRTGLLGMGALSAPAGAVFFTLPLPLRSADFGGGLMLPTARPAAIMNFDVSDCAALPFPNMVFSYAYANFGYFNGFGFFMMFSPAMKVKQNASDLSGDLCMSAFISALVTTFIFPLLVGFHFTSEISPTNESSFAILQSRR